MEHDWEGNILVYPNLVSIWSTKESAEAERARLGNKSSKYRLQSSPYSVEAYLVKEAAC
jgi:hypothetical protein